jgi:hypothetical protein
LPIWHVVDSQPSPNHKHATAVDPNVDGKVISVDEHCRRGLGGNRTLLIHG